MSKKISDYFKIETKVNHDFELIQQNTRASAEVKNEKEATFEKDLDKFQLKLAKNTEKEFSFTRIRECRVILEDINKKVQNGNLTINQSDSKGKLKSNCIKNSPQHSKSKCKYCGNNFRSDYILDHMNRVHSAEMTKEQNGCKICNRKFLNLRSLMFHMNIKHSKEFFSTPSNLECDFDGKIFKTKEKLQCHMQCHQSKVKCEFCQKELTQTRLRKHIRDVHTEDRKFQCKICPKTFKSISVLKSHIQSHNKEFECSTCSKMLPNQSHLNMHIEQYHRNPNNYECEICGKKFNQKSNFRTHQKIHEKNRPHPYKCQRCDYSTDCKGSHKGHQKSHERQDRKYATMKNPQKCTKCSKFCKSKQAFNDHMRFVHPEFPYQCDLCGMYVKVKSSFKKHFLVHLKNQNN